MATDPINTQTLGGLTYDANKTQATGVDRKTQKFFIIFKGGDKITYPQQPQYDDGTTPRVDVRRTENLIYDDMHFNISNVMGATFSSSKDTVSDVKLINCHDTTVDLSANESAWYGDKARISGGKGNQVKLDSNDQATISGFHITGEGIAAQKDYER